MEASVAVLQNPMLAPVKMNVSDQEIAKLVEQFSGLTIAGVDDKAGYKAVYEARQVVKKTRVGLQKYGKDLREDAQAWAKKVIAEEKRLVAPLETLEGQLQSEEDRIDAEKARIKAEAEAKEKARVQARIDRLAAYGFAIDVEHVTNLPDAEFEGVVLEAKAAWEKEQADKAEAERLAKEEQERLAAEQRAKDEELAKLRKEAQERAAADAERLEKEQAKQNLVDRAMKTVIDQLSSYGVVITRAEIEAMDADEFRALTEKAKKDYEARILKAEEERKEREAQERTRAEQDAKDRAEHEAKLREARRPDREKLERFCSAMGGVVFPEAKTEYAILVLEGFKDEYHSLLNKFAKEINSL